MTELSSTTPHDSPDAQAGMRGWPWFASMVLAVLALGVSGYLVYASVAEAGPVGCGGGSGCAEVLGSKWAKVLGVPVGVLAAVAYLGALVAIPLTRSEAPTTQRRAWVLCGVVCGSILASAGWFIYLQVAVLDALCPYCMAGHALGAGLALVVIGAAATVGQKPAWIGLPVGIALAAAVAVLQVQIDAPAHRLHVPTQGDYDITDDTGRRIGLLGGVLQLDLNEEPVIGNPNAPAVMAMMFDYACPHCQRAHRALEEARDRLDDPLAVVLLPVPVNGQCNRRMHSDHERFADSCERARLLIALSMADRGAIGAFDAWMIDVPIGSYRTGAEARAKAEELVGAEALAAALARPEVDQMIQRNVEAYASLGVARIPVMLTPWTEPICCNIEDAEAIESFLARARADRRTNGGAKAANP